MLATVTWALAALAGEPQCSPKPQGCPYVIDPRFGDAHVFMHQYYTPKPDETTAKNLAAACTPDYWQQRSRCADTCALRLEVTAPAGHEATYCLHDNGFVPFVPEGHMDMHHPLNGKEMDVVAVGEPGAAGRWACSGKDFEGVDYAGKIAFLMRGKCYFRQKFANARAAGAAAGIMTNSNLFHMQTVQTFNMGGGSQGLDLPAAMFSRQVGMPLFDALDSGVRLRGKLVFNCESPADAPDRDPAAAEYAARACPSSQVRKLCLEEAQPARRLCSSCPMTMVVPRDAAANLSVCLYNNDLLPSKAATFFPLAKSLPYAAADDEVAVVPPSKEFNPCEGGHYAGLAGKIAMLPWPTQCVAVMAAIRAQRAGVAAVIFYNQASFYGLYVAEGASKYVNIPVHGTGPEDYESVAALFDAPGRVEIGVGAYGNVTAYLLPGATFDPEARNQTVLADEDVQVQNRTAAAELTVTVASFDWTPPVIICLVVITTLTGLLSVTIAKLVIKHKAIALGGAEGVSLDVASMSLSITLLTVIATVAFTMAHAAGEKSTDMAMEHGRAAVADTFATAVAGSDVFAKQLMTSVLYLGTGQIERMVSDLKTKVSWLKRHYSRGDRSWREFNERWLSHQYQDQKLLKDIESYVYTANGFFGGPLCKTDDRKIIGANGTVAESQNGFEYGSWTFHWDAADKQALYWADTPKEESSPFNMLSSEYGNPLDFTADMAAGEWKWKLSTYSYPTLVTYQNKYNWLSLSVYEPLTDDAGRKYGAAEARIAVHNIEDYLTVARGALTANLTVVVFSEATFKYYCHLAPSGSVSYSAHKFQQAAIHSTGSRKSMTEHIHLSQSQVDLLRAMHKFIVTKNITSSMMVEALDSVSAFLFDESDYYTPLFDPVWILGVDQGTGMMKDQSGEGAFFGMREADGTPSACGQRCVAADASTGRQVITFSGSQYLEVEHVLSMDAAQVQATKLPTEDGTWKSSHHLFQNMRPHGDGFCPTITLGDYDEVAEVWHDDTKCLLRGHFVVSSWSLTLRVRPAVTIPESGGVGGKAPRLFSTVLTGDARIRWLGNGKLLLGTLEFGCATKPIPGGVPGGKWTVLTAVGIPEHGSGQARKCLVYADGELVSEGDMADGYSRSVPADASLHTIGQDFTGEMDYVQLERKALDAEEVASLHSQLQDSLTPASKVVLPADKRVPKREWYLSFAQTAVTADMIGAQGDWMLAALLPREDVMRETDAQNKRAVRDLLVSEQNTETYMMQSQAEAVFVLVAVGLTCVVLFLQFNDLITKPFEAVAGTMVEVAAMRLDGPVPEKSLLKEINIMHHALKMMKSNLREYKSYMPQWLCEGETDSETDSDIGTETSVDSANFSAGRGVVPRPTSPRRRNSRNKRRESKASCSSGLASLSEGSVQGVNRMCGRLAVTSLSMRGITLMALNLVSFEKLFENLAPGSVLGLHAKALSTLIAIISNHRGRLDSFMGDRFLGSFNAVKVAGLHASYACSAAWDASEAISKDPDLKTTCALVRGNSRVGNMGNDEVKRYGYISPLLGWCLALERICRKRRLFGRVLVDHHVVMESEQNHLFMYQDRVLYTKLSRPSFTCELRGPFAMEAGEQKEWMYELEQAGVVDPYRTWNDFFRAVYSQNWDDALKMRTAVDDATIPASVRDVHDRLYPQLLRICQVMSVPEPTVIEETTYVEPGESVNQS
eukprot:TRINITY_DN6368_c0_g2_i1.p1 TRINITY_DN6368_c0_g2~~TRINITY_DN6368_c0_g2_i1.p1  ORF type:complete len:1692 (+),score=407.97 TRINITY_DN6368_c0_g2_i1:76-5151(+)